MAAFTSPNLFFQPQSYCSYLTHKSSSNSSSFLPSNKWNLLKLKTYTNSSFTRRASSGINANVVEVLEDVGVFSASTGDRVFFRDLWDQKEQVAVIALMRHFGCICCWELASVLKEAKPRFDSSGVKLIAVGVGTPDKARILAEGVSFPLECLYADPDFVAYKALGLYYGVGRTFFNSSSAKVLLRLDSIRNASKNYTTSAIPSDTSTVWQQGGMFVFKGKKLLYARKDEGTGDHASMDDVFDACCKMAVK